MRRTAALSTTGVLTAAFAWAVLSLQSNFGSLPLVPTILVATVTGLIAVTTTLIMGERHGRLQFREVAGGISVGSMTVLGLSLGLQWFRLGPTGQSNLGVSLPFDTGIGIAGALLVLGILVAAWGEHQATPTSLFLMAAGMVLSHDLVGLAPYLTPGNAAALSSLALVIILYDGGLGTSRRHIEQGLGPGLALATIGVVVTALTVGLIAHFGLGFPLVLSLLLGAALSPTDAAAVLALLREVPLPSRAASILRIESGTNDPVAILLTAGLLATAHTYTSSQAWLVFGIVQAIGGLSVGVVLGFLGARAINKVARYSPSTAAVLGLSVALTVYGAGVALGVSGFLAVYVAGVVVRAHHGTGQVATTRLTAALGTGSETALFLLLGMMTNPATLIGDLAKGLLLSAVLLFLARPFAGLFSLVPFRLPAGESIAITWLGLRGAVPIVLATVMLLEGASHSAQIYNIVFIVVVVSLLVQSFSAKPLLRYLDLPQDAHEPVEVDALPLEGVDPRQFSMYQVSIPNDSPLIGHELWESPPPQSLRLVSISRGDETINPRGSTILQAHDVLVVSTDDPDHNYRVICDWVTPDEPTGEQPQTL